MANSDETHGTDAREHPAKTDTSDRSDSARSRPRDQREQAEPGADVMHGRSFAGQNIANTERGQTRDRERVVRGETLDEAGESVTDAEVEARISRRAERHED